MHKQLLKTVAIGFIVTLFSCGRGPAEPPKPPQPPTPPAPAECKYTGKIEKVICGDGIWYNFWIRLNDGKLLRPCTSSVAVPDKSKIYEGMPVEIDYQAVRYDQCNNTGIICQAVPPEHTVVNLTCFKARTNQ